MANLDSLIAPYKSYGILFQQQSSDDGLNITVINEVNGKQAIAELPTGDVDTKIEILEQAIEEVK